MKLPKKDKFGYTLLLSQENRYGKECIICTMFGENISYHNRHDAKTNVLVSLRTERKMTDSGRIGITAYSEKDLERVERDYRKVVRSSSETLESKIYPSEVQ